MKSDNGFQMCFSDLKNSITNICPWEYDQISFFYKQLFIKKLGLSGIGLSFMLAITHWWELEGYACIYWLSRIGEIWRACIPEMWKLCSPFLALLVNIGWRPSTLLKQNRVNLLKQMLNFLGSLLVKFLKTSIIFVKSLNFVS